MSAEPLKLTSAEAASLRSALPYMNEQELAEAERLLTGSETATLDTPEIIQARESIEGFTLFTKQDYQVSWHHRKIFDAVDRWIAGEITRLMLFLPPRAGKSEIGSRRAPAYILGKNPDSQIISCSYGASLASRMNRDVQRIMDSPRYAELFPETRLMGKNIRTVARSGSYLRNSDTFEIVGHSGTYRCAGIGGGIMGFGFTAGIIDDVIKSAEEAHSKTYRDKVWEWYTSVFYPRQAKDGRILVIMTRWHHDDLAGRLLEQAKRDPSADQWTVIRFPAVAGKEIAPDDPRRPGESLWPERFTDKFLASTKAQMSAYEWGAVYQQDPSPEEGGLFKAGNLRYFNEIRRDGSLVGFELHPLAGPPKVVMADRCRWFQTCDTAMKLSQQNDFTCVGTFVLTPDFELLVYDMWRDRVPVPRQFAMLALQKERYPQVLFQGVEDKVSGTGILQQASIEGVAMRALKADIDKVRRASNVAMMYENGRVYHRHGAAWLHEYEQELLHFPTGKFDDQVDVASHAGNLAMQDELLRSSVKGDLFLYPNPDDPSTVSVRDYGGVEEVRFGKTTVYFDDDDDAWHNR